MPAYGRFAPADLVLPVAALAPLYTGHLGPAVLARMGLAEGSQAGLSLAALLFGGPILTV